MDLLSKNVERFFKFMGERHAIYLKRHYGHEWPWTDDDILRTYKFTNIYRELDTGTIWLRENIREPYAQHPELFFNIAMYRRYNHWPFAQRLMDKFGFFEDYGKVIHDVVDYVVECQRNHIQVFTGAHMICGTLRAADGSNIPSKAVQVFEVGFSQLWEKRNLVCPQPGDTLEMAFNRLMGTHIAGFGDFIAYEVITDLRWTRYLEDANDKMAWANPGPGAIRGIKRLSGIPVKSGAVNRKECILAIKELVEEANLSRPKWMQTFEARDIEHSLCEFDKYERVRTGEGHPRSKFVPPQLRKQ